jgi:fructokinase
MHAMSEFVMASRRLFMHIGIDLGGTKIEGILLGPDGQELARRRVPSPRGSYPDTLGAIAALVHTLEAQGHARCTVGVGIPGALSPETGLVKTANSTWLIGHPLDRDLAVLLDRPVAVANDANCFTLSEATDGAGAGARVVFGVILGTGVGGCLTVDGRVLEGPHRIAGEWGHLPLPWPSADETPGPPCYCGRSGCVETWMSGPGWAAEFQRATGRTLTADALATAAQSGQDPEAAAAFDRYAGRLARGLAMIITLLDPDVIVLGGGVSNVGALYEAVPSRWSRWVFSDAVHTPLRPARFGDASGVRGAAWLGRTAATHPSA